jgi:hypothetical protein
VNDDLKTQYEIELAHVRKKLQELRALQAAKEPPKPIHWFWRFLETLRAYTVNEEPRF